MHDILFILHNKICISRRNIGVCALLRISLDFLLVLQSGKENVENHGSVSVWSGVFLGKKDNICGKDDVPERSEVILEC